MNLENISITINEVQAKETFTSIVKATIAGFAQNPIIWISAFLVFALVIVLILKQLMDNSEGQAQILLGFLGLFVGTVAVMLMLLIFLDGVDRIALWNLIKEKLFFWRG